MFGFSMLRRGGIFLSVQVALCLIVLLVASLAAGQTRVASGSATGAAQAPTLHVLTFGPGDHIFTRFGHDALWVHDPAAPRNRRDLVFNYGTFRFDSPWLLLDFLKGNLGYWLSYSTLQRTLAGYKAANRAISAQQLSLSPEVARRMVRFLYENAKPENKYYRYDYYDDNCSTRIRDLLDDHLNHRLKNASGGPASLNLREHTRRLTQSSPGFFFGIDLILGPGVDRPITDWEAMFLPSELAKTLQRVSLGSDSPLVARQHDLLTAVRSPEPQSVPDNWGWLLIGLALGGIFFALGRLHTQRWAAIAFSLALAIFCLLAGLLGTGLWILCLYTDLDVTYWNQNVILTPIWALFFPWVCIDWLRRKPLHTRRAVLWSVGTAGFVWFLCLAQPFLPQHSEPAMGFFLPVWTGIALAIWGRSSESLPVRWSRFARADARR